VGVSYVIDKDRELSTPLLLTPHTLSPERENGDYLSLLTEAMQGKNRASPQVESHHREAERVLQNSEVLLFFFLLPGACQLLTDCLTHHLCIPVCNNILGM